MIDKSKLTSVKLRCVWDIESEGGKKCTSEVYELDILGNRIRVPICAHHLEDHVGIMSLWENGYDPEEYVNKGYNYRKELMLTLKLSGLDTSTNKL